MFKHYPAGGGILSATSSSTASAGAVATTSTSGGRGTSSTGTSNYVNHQKRVNSQSSIYAINHHDYNNVKLCQQLKLNDNNHLNVGKNNNKSNNNNNINKHNSITKKNANENNSNASQAHLHKENVDLNNDHDLLDDDDDDNDADNGNDHGDNNSDDDDDEDNINADATDLNDNNDNNEEEEDDDDVDEGEDDEDGMDVSNENYNLNKLKQNQHAITTNEPSINSNAHSTPIRTFTFFRFALIKFLLNQRISRNVLTVLTPVAASFSVAIVIAAIAGPLWLITEEKIPKIYSRPFANFSRSDGYFDTTYTKSSLWSLCVKQGGSPSYNCLEIDYFANEIYSPDPNNSTNVIPYAIKHSTPFFIVSCIILLISYFLFLMAMCSNSNQHKMYYFFSGVIFIISGLIMLIGLIVYISIFKAEIRYKLRPRSMLQEPLFSFNYGQSFKLFIIGLMITELSGILNVLLYTSLYQQRAYNLTNNTSKKKTIYYTAKFPKGHKYTINDEIDYSCNNGNVPTHQKHHQVFYCDLPPSPMMNNAKRYYLKKDFDNINSNSLNELYLETNFPSHQYQHPQRQRQRQHQLQQQMHQQLQQKQRRQFPTLSRSVSTTTDFFPNFLNEANHSHNVGDVVDDEDEHNDNNNDGNGRGGANNKDHSDNGNDNDKDMYGIGENNLLHTDTNTDTNNNVNKDKLFGEFCKKVGARPIPKNIYYIEDDTSQDDNNIFIIDSQSQNYQQQQLHHQRLVQREREWEREREREREQLQRQRQYQSQNLINNLEKPKLFSPNQLNHSLRDVNFHLNDEQYKYYRNDDLNRNYSGYSRTLPRNFLKRKYDINDNHTNRRISAAGLYSPLSSEYQHHLSQHQPPRQQQYHRNTSFDNLLMNNDRIFDNYVKPQWPKVLTKSPSIYSNHSYLGVPLATMPGAGLSGLGGGATATTSSTNASSAASYLQPKQNNNNRYHHLNDILLSEQQQIPATFFNDISSFDLDQIERERRKSHSSLFESTLLTASNNLINEYDFKNGTPV